MKSRTRVYKRLTKAHWHSDLSSYLKSKPAWFLHDMHTQVLKHSGSTACA